MQSVELLLKLLDLNARYAASLDRGALEEWPGYFVEDATYRVSSSDNYRAGLKASLIYARGQGMLKDRVQALRQANIYERQSYRHVLGMPLIGPTASEPGAELEVETSFLVVRTMRTGQMDVFASGMYVDKVSLTGSVPMFRERIAVCDSSRIDTLLAIPL